MTTAIATLEPAQAVTVKHFGDNLIERFVKFAGVKPESQRTYAKALRQLFAYLADNSITNPTRENLIDWVDGMKAEKKSASTIQLYLTATKIFFRWTAQEGIFANIADHMKSGVKLSHNHKKDALSTDQCAELIKNVKCISKVKGQRNELQELRDKAILSLMTTAGLRTIEVVRADVGNLRFERGKVFLYVQGKGHDDADEKVLIGKKTYKAIQAYLKIRGKYDGNSPLFASTSRRNRGARLTTQTIRAMVKKNLRGIGLDSPRLTAHSLRHSVATNLIFAGVELPRVQMVLRHKDISTTMIYANAWERYQNDGEQILENAIFKE